MRAYYIAELLADWTEEDGPHPNLFEEALATLADLGQPDVPTGPRLARFELVLLRELGYSPTLESCAVCAAEWKAAAWALASRQAEWFARPARARLATAGRCRRQHGKRCGNCAGPTTPGDNCTMPGFVAKCGYC